jgi:hypothetical protein
MSGGSRLRAAAVQMGFAGEELTVAELDVHDPRFPVLTTMVAHTRS